MLKVKDKERILKTKSKKTKQKQKQFVMYKRNPIRLAADFSAETLQA